MAIPTWSSSNQPSDAQNTLQHLSSMRFEYQRNLEGLSLHLKDKENNTHVRYKDDKWFQERTERGYPFDGLCKVK